MRRIMEVVRLIHVLEDKKYTRQEKADQIKMVRDNGDIDFDESIELALEYLME